MIKITRDEKKKIFPQVELRKKYLRHLSGLILDDMLLILHPNRIIIYKYILIEKTTNNNNNKKREEALLYNY